VFTHSGPHNLVNIYLRNDGIDKYQTAVMERGCKSPNRRRPWVSYKVIIIFFFFLKIFFGGGGGGGGGGFHFLTWGQGWLLKKKNKR
jgi:hypothetical protein